MCQILIAEDEVRLAAFIVKGLQKNGFTPTVVTNGVQALEATQSNVYDVILLDLGLPLKDGWTVLRELRERGDSSPVIVVTALSGVDREVINSGANEYVSKPFRFRELLAAVQRQMLSSQLNA